MFKSFLYVVAAVAVAALVAANAVKASHIEGACADQLNAVEAAIAAARFTGMNAEMDQTRMLAKLDAADAKVDQEKYSDAIDKLDEIASKADELATAPKSKLNGNDATIIIEKVAYAIGCVGSLGD